MMLQEGQDIRSSVQHSQYTRGEGRDHNNYDTNDNEIYDVDDVHNDNDDERSRW